MFRFIVPLLLPALLAGQDIIAHRGYSAKAPENTLASLKLGWEAGAEGCECDVYLTKDGGIVLMHDKTTKRTTSVDLKVADSMLADLTKLDAGSWKDRRWSQERVPTLAQALAAMPEGKQRIVIEIKCDAEIVPALKAELTKWQHRAHQLCIITFQKKAAFEAKKALPWVPVYLLSGAKSKKPGDAGPKLDALIKEAVEHKLDGLDLGKDWPWSAEMVKQIEDAGLKTIVYTINDPAEMKRLAEMGVDGITTDEPELARAAVKR